MITSVQSLTRIGERLPNGAVLVDRAWTRTEDWANDRTYHEAIVLAVLNHGSRHEFVTWLYCLNPDDGEVTINGRYFDGLLHAVVDFKQRVKAQKMTGKYAPRILT